MTQQIKFRGLGEEIGGWIYGDLCTHFESGSDSIHIIDKEGSFHEVLPNTVGQFVWLHDKKGKEIYEHSFLRVRGVMGDKAEYTYDAIYKVNKLGPEGVVLSFVRSSLTQPSLLINSYPICLHPRFGKELIYDYKNSNEKNIAFDNTFGENTFSKQRWREHHYTNDIEVFDEHELLITESN